MATITYGKVKQTRHSVKHCVGVKRQGRHSIVAGNKHLCKEVSPEEQHRRDTTFVDTPSDYILAGRVERLIKCRDGTYEVYLVSAGSVLHVEPSKPAPARVKETEHDYKEMFKPFKPLKAPSVGCSAKGGFNSGTKDRSVQGTVSASPDVDNVSSMTGVVPLSRDGHHKTKISETAYAKERARFRENMDKHYRYTGQPEGARNCM